MIVIDTNILIDLIRGHSRPREVLADVLMAGTATASVLSKTEILAGVRARETAQSQELFALMGWIPVDDAIAERAGELANRYVRSHQGIEIVDYVIAATAELLDAELWTLNVRHFPMFPGLRAPY